MLASGLEREKGVRDDWTPPHVSRRGFSNRFSCRWEGVQQEVMSTPESFSFLFPLYLSLSSGAGGEKDKEERGKRMRMSN
jgi:hypothetical protein